MLGTVIVIVIDTEFSNDNSQTMRTVNRPLAHDVIAPVTMHLEDKLAIYA